MKRLPFLDWMRGLAVVIMIECHVFNSFARHDLRNGGPYVLSQFVGGMAAVLFLFMTGMTLAFQMESLDRREPSRFRRWTGALRRGAYVLMLAYAFRLTNYLAGLPRSHWTEIVKVDILNCMGVGMLALSALAALRPAVRVRAAALAGIAIACSAPLVAALPWGATPFWIREYLDPNPVRFPFFPWTAYVAFGIALGILVRRTAPDRVERLMQWAVLAGIPLIVTGQYFANLPYSLYASARFWVDSPALVFIRLGIVLLIMAAAYLWTDYCAGNGWSWMQALGKTSLMAYWVHVMLVYGDVAKPLKGALSIPMTAAAAVAVTAAMVGLAALRLSWQTRRSLARARVAAAQ